MITSEPPQKLPSPRDIQELWDAAGLENPGIPGPMDDEQRADFDRYEAEQGFARRWEALGRLPGDWELDRTLQVPALDFLGREVAGVSVTVYIEPDDWTPGGQEVQDLRQKGRWYCGEEIPLVPPGVKMKVGSNEPIITQDPGIFEVVRGKIEALLEMRRAELERRQKEEREKVERVLGI